VRIFLTLAVATNAAAPGNRVWDRYLRETLVEMGHDVVLCRAEDGQRAMATADAALRAAFSERLAAEFARGHAERHFDLVFAYLMDGMVEPAVIDQIRAAGVPTVNFSCNNVHQFDLVDELAPHFDRNLHAERDVAEKFHAVGATPLWWPMAANPRYAHPVDVPRTLEASFVGGNYALRARYVLSLLERGVDVHAYGPRWTLAGRRRRFKRRLRRDLTLARAWTSYRGERKAWRTRARQIDVTRTLTGSYPAHLHDPIDDDAVIRLYSASHVSLGFLEVYDRHDAAAPVLRHVHLREFEAPMSGALYATNYCDELGEYFEPGSEVVVWEGADELAEKVRYYVAHREEADKIRAAGRRRALACHTYQRRFVGLFDALGLKA